MERETNLNIHQRILAVMGDVTYVQKKRNKDMPYAAVSHDDVVSALRPAMLKYGISVKTSVLEAKVEGNQTQCLLLVRFTNVDNPEDFVEVRSFGLGNDKQDKGPGKAETYAYKYALLKNFMLETGDEDPDLHSVNTEIKKTFQGSRPQVEQLKLLFNKAGVDKSEDLRRSLAESFIGKTWDEIKEELELG